MKLDRTAGYQNWNDLLFLHWRIASDAIQPLLPDDLQVETFDGSAWIGLVPFSMEGVRPWWSPAVPGISNFLETNVRTYVRHSNGTSGVWFFSLDADNRLAVQIARRFWFLPYHDCRLTLQRDEGAIRYTGRRPDGKVRYAIDATVDSSNPLLTSEPDSLNEFLLERYTLFAPSPGGLRTGQVHHEPYQFRQARVERFRQTLTEANGIPDIGEQLPPDHIVYSPGVEVRVSALNPVAAG